jgi:nitroreductase
VYRYDAGTKRLSFIRQVPPVQARADLFVQSEFSSSPAVIWIVGDLVTACKHGGALGHRRLLLRAGAAAHRLWISALAVGLDGAIVAGVVPGNAQALLGFDPQFQAGLLALTLGHAAPGQPDEEKYE